MGRPSLYSDELADSICERLCEGESLRSICRDEAMPGMATVMRWLADPELEGFREQYAHAREAQGEVSADNVRDIGARTLRGEVDPKAARVAIDAEKWAAGTLLPRKYGTRVQHADANGDLLPPPQYNITPVMPAPRHDDPA